MASKQTNEDSVLLKTNTSIEKLPDGSCIKKITQIRDGKTVVKEEKLDCDQALQEVREKDGDGPTEEKDSFDQQMREKLNDIKKSFSKEEDKANFRTTEETSTDGTNKTVKVTRESNSIEETKKTEKIPDGTKRILKITKESFLEETKKSVGPMETQEEPEEVKLLDENFAEESKSETPKVKKGSVEEKKSEEASNVKEEGGKEESDENREDEDENDVSEKEDPAQFEGLQRNSIGMKLVKEEDGFLSKTIKFLVKALFWPLYKMKIL